MNAAEKPFFQDRRKRAGMVRRVGNLAAKISSTDSELVALHAELVETDESVKSSFLKQVIACHLEFISPVSRQEATQLAKTAGVGTELANLRNLRPDLSNAPEIVQAAFTDAATIVKRGMEAA
jgi:hypothetical protein